MLPRPIDPFAGMAEISSAVAGLGGPQPSADPSLAFATGPQAFEAGAVAFDIAFSALTASRGSLSLYVDRLEADGTARTEKIVYATLADLAAAGGRYRLTLEAEAGAAYRIHGHVHEEADAAAAALGIVADVRADASPLADRLAAGRRLFTPRRRGLLATLTARGAPTLAAPVSQMCTAAQMEEPLYDHWLRRMARGPHRHRKQWEFVYIAQVLAEAGMLAPGRRGLGFGVGIEPLPALFAAHGVDVLATDLAPDDARAAAWSLTHQHGRALDDLRLPAICPDDAFDAHVRFEPADMNAIPAHFRDFDFCWSSCALEHLGTIDAGLTFIERSLETLRPGGLAVHTTELNLTSNFRTMRRGATVLFRRRDIERLVLRLLAAGHRVMPINWEAGDHQDDRFVDVPPYSSDIHLKVAMRRFVTTSFGLIVRKAG